MIKILKFALSMASLPFLLFSCNGKNDQSSDCIKYSAELKAELKDSIEKIIKDFNGEIGVVIIVNNCDTICVNNSSVYPMMSVFKLHQGIALCDNFNRMRLKLDTVLSIARSELNPNTWSPMLKEHSEDTLRIPVSELLHYAITQSDNNASNIMFNRLVSVEETDSMIATLIPREDFKISFTEEEMFHDHSKAYSNYTSPIGAAGLINLLMTDSILTSENKECIAGALMDCKTGQDRIIKPLLDKGCEVIAHKTGSGYRNERGVLAAHNDVAYVKLTDGKYYSLAVFVKDTMASEEEASEAIAHISELVYRFVENANLTYHKS